jgi:Ni,Fe-hydrogenase III small subunit/ferredoxin
MPWIPRGLHDGIVTTGYPRRHDDYGESFCGTIEVRTDHISGVELSEAIGACPTNAISAPNGKVLLDRGKCILCGRCAELAPQVFRMTPSFETASVMRQGLVVPSLDESSADLETVRTKLADRVKHLHRSIHVRHIDCGSDGADEWEVAALTNPIYDVQRLGIYFTASPRHADVLLVTGVGSSGMAASLQQTLDEMPRPTVVIAAGVDALSGGLIGEGYSSLGGVGSIVQIDVFVPGSPATPFGLLYGILTAINLLPRTRNVTSGGSRP